MSTFIKEWILRSERKEGIEFIDMGDKFICLYISFNAWQKDKYGSEKKDDILKNETISNDEMRNAFNVVKENISKELDRLKQFNILDMRNPEDLSKAKKYNNSFESLIECLYQIRCNLFHGRKNYQDNLIDKELVELGYKILHPIFKEYLSEHQS